ncbi:MAG TPA: hypothetical protein VKP89_09940 [Burkholderiales bacterium]|nr:hypothetical protein [Burkholderiales bacterium]
MRGLPAWLLLGAALVAGAAGRALAEAPNWEVAHDSGCALRSAPQTVNDGYQTVQARIVVDAAMVVVESPSDLDDSFSDIGLALPGHDFIRMDRVEGKKRAVFVSRYADLVEAFKAGRDVEARLRFWPEFPVTGVHGARFSLMGFTKAYDEAKGCK